MPEHWVLLAETVQPGVQRGRLHVQRRGQLSDLLVIVRQEFVERRIEQTDRDRQARHDLEQLNEVLALHRQDLRERRASAAFVRGDDHFAHRHDAGRVKEHVLCAAKPNAFRSELPGLGGIVRRIGIGTNLHSPHAVGPFHERCEVPRQFGLTHGDLTPNDLAGRSVDGYEVALLERYAARADRAQFRVDAKNARTGDAGASHAAGHNGSMAGHAAARGQNPGRGMHAMDVFRACFGAHKDYGLALRLQLLGIVGGENDLAAGRARGGGQAGCQDVAFGRWIDGRMKHLIELSRLDAGYGFFLGDEPFPGKINRDFESRRVVRLPLLHWSIQSLPSWMVNSMFCMSR